MGPQTKQNKQTHQRQPTLTPCWDVNGCQGRSTLYYYMSCHPTQPKGPSETRRASKQSTITRAHDSLQNHNFILYSALHKRAPTIHFLTGRS